MTAEERKAKGGVFDASIGESKTETLNPECFPKPRGGVFDASIGECVLVESVSVSSPHSRTRICI